MTGTLADDLRRWVETETGAAIESVAPIGRGASRRIWAVDLDDGRSLVVREDTGTGPVAGTPLDLAREATVYRALGGSGLPVPALHAVSPDRRALLLERAPGVEEFTASTDDERHAATDHYGRCLADLHALDPPALDLGPLQSPAEASRATRCDVELWQTIHDERTGRWATPPASLALRWLRDNAPTAAHRTSLCHGDAGPGNFLHEGGRVTAMLDWEFAHLGDPHDDLAWVAVRNQVLRRPLDVAVIYRAWRDAIGDDIDVGLLEYFRALVLTRMLVSCDATLNWTGGDESAAPVQAALRPYLAVAVLEALRRAGAGDDVGSDLEASARQAWEGSLVAGVLGDPSDLDDLGAAL